MVLRVESRSELAFEVTRLSMLSFILNNCSRELNWAKLGGKLGRIIGIEGILVFQLGNKQAEKILLSP